jgi:two-component system response regulator
MLSADDRTSLSEADPVTPGLVVLLVDDDPDCRLLVRDAVEETERRRGVSPPRVMEVDSGEAALRLLRQEGEFAGHDVARPGLIYMDVEMPGIGGLETVRRIKADPALRDIPVVVLSGLSDPTAIRDASRSGANSYTVKPADADRLLEAVLCSTDYWLHVHQTPVRHIDQAACRRSDSAWPGLES